MKLSIDSSSNKTLLLTIDEHQKVIQFESPREQDILLAIEHFLKELHLDLQQLTTIEVSTGPGSFTSLRTGIAIAQSLSFALHIPINGLPPGTTIEAQYGKPLIKSPLAFISPSR